MALASARKPERFDTEQDGQLTCGAWLSRLESGGIQVNMEGRARWLDNVFIERLWWSLEYEEIYLHDCASVHGQRQTTQMFFHQNGIPRRISRCIQACHVTRYDNMSLFGSFSEIAPADVISLVSKSLGRLRVNVHDSGLKYEICISSGVINRLLQSQEEVTDSEQAFSRITDLILLRTGDFVFTKGEESPGPLNLHIEHVLGACSSEAEELVKWADDLPSPETRFVATYQAGHLHSKDLSEFFDAVRPILRSPTCAHDIASNLRMPLSRVLLRLYKLRACGHIRPFRTIGKLMATTPSAVPELNGCFSQNGGNSTNPPTTDSLQSFALYPEAAHPERPLGGEVDQRRARIELPNIGHRASLSEVSLARVNRSLTGIILAGLRRSLGIAKTT